MDVFELDKFDVSILFVQDIRVSKHQSFYLNKTKCFYYMKCKFI